MKSYLTLLIAIFTSLCIPLTSPASAPYRVLISAPDNEVETDTGPIYGLYATKAACLADIPKQISIYEINTGLTVTTASCDPDQLYGESFILSLEGYGEPAQHLYAFQPFREGITANEAAVALSILQSSPVHSIQQMGTVFLYYAPKQAVIRSQPLGLFENQEQCEAQVTDMEKMLTKSSAKHLGVVCVKDENYATYSAHIIDDSFYWLEDDFALGSPVYDTFAACLADKERYLAISSNEQGHDLGGLCEIGTSSDALGRFKIYTITLL